MPRKATNKTEKKVKKKVETPPVETPPVETPSVENENESLIDILKPEFSHITTQLRDMVQTIRTLQTRINHLEKVASKEIRSLEKKKTKRARTVNTQNGFSKPGNVSDELRKFLNLGDDELIARTEVTKRITEYCNKHNLQNDADKRIILPNNALRKLLRLGTKEELTYFNLQKYMKVHFPNKDGVFIHA